MNKIKKGTFSQNIEVSECKTDIQRIETWNKFGFTALEAQAMVKGSTRAETIRNLGGVWKVGNVEWYQAINKIHAQKLHVWNFGKIDQTSMVTK